MAITAASQASAVTTSTTGGESSTLQKAKLYMVESGKYKTSYSDFSQNTALECQFNPASISISKEVEWNVVGDDKGKDTSMADKNAPQLEWKGGSYATFSLDLFFDTTDQDPADKTKRDVRRYTNDLLALTLGPKKNDKVQEPGSVVFVWGEFVLFEAVVTKVVISYLQFDANGIPTRARAGVDFVQQDYAMLDSGYTVPQNPTSRTEPRKTWLVEQGQSLHLIAHQEYGHVRHWRHIADSNNILNPLDLQPGQILVLPPLP